MFVLNCPWLYFQLDFLWVWRISPTKFVSTFNKTYPLSPTERWCHPKEKKQSTMAQKKKQQGWMTPQHEKEMQLIFNNQFYAAESVTSFSRTDLQVSSSEIRSNQPFCWTTILPVVRITILHETMSLSALQLSFPDPLHPKLCPSFRDPDSEPK